jgi:hypothetical protein
MKVQLSGKEYISNLEGLGFETMLDTFLSIWTIFGSKPVGQKLHPRFKFGLNSDQFEFKLELEFKFGQILE